MVSAVPAEHDSVGYLLESRYAAATVEVFEALRERACRSIEDADVIEREDLAGFSAPLDSFLRVAAHEPGIAGWKVSGNSTNLVVIPGSGQTVHSKTICERLPYRQTLSHTRY